MRNSREDTLTTEPTITNGGKATMATVWETVVCGLYDADYWEFTQGGNTYVDAQIRSHAVVEKPLIGAAIQDSWRSTHTSPSSKTPMASYPAHGPSLRVSAQESQSRYWP